MRNVVLSELVSLDGVRATERYGPSTHRHCCIEPSSRSAAANSSDHPRMSRLSWQLGQAKLPALPYLCRPDCRA